MIMVGYVYSNSNTTLVSINHRMLRSLLYCLPIQIQLLFLLILSRHKFYNASYDSNTTLVSINLGLDHKILCVFGNSNTTLVSINLTRDLSYVRQKSLFKYNSCFY